MVRCFLTEPGIILRGNIEPPSKDLEDINKLTEEEEEEEKNASNLINIIYIQVLYANRQITKIKNKFH